MDEDGPCDLSSSQENLTSDDLFNDIINVAYSLEDENKRPDEKESTHAISNIKHNEITEDFYECDLEDKCAVQRQPESENDAYECMNSISSNSHNAAEENKCALDLDKEGTGECLEGCKHNSVTNDLSRSSSKSSFSDASISSSLTSSEFSPSLDNCDGFSQDHCSFSNQEMDSFKPSRPKSYSLASTQSEMDFIINENERRFARMSLERDKRPPIYSGFLNKLGGTGFTPKNWRKRWFVLKRDNCLYYYKDPKNSPVGAVILSNYIVTTVALGVGKKFAFQLTKGGARTYTFAAASDIERKTWMKVIAEAAKMPNRLSATPEISIHNVSIPALSIKDPDCHGYLWKQGFSHKSWKRRYSVLKDGCLYYYQDMSETVALGVFNLHCYTLQETESTGRKYSFVAIPPQTGMRTYYFSAENAHDRDRWLQAMVTSIGETGEEK